MSMNEMMRSFANQNREQQKQSSTLKEELNAISQRLNMLEEQKSQNEQIIQHLNALNEYLAALKMSGQHSLSSEIQDLSKQLAAILERQNPVAVSSIAEQVLKAATQKEERANSTLEQSKEHVRQAQTALSRANETARTIQHAAKTIEGAPKAMLNAGHTARNELTSSLRFLTLKAAVVGVLIALTTCLIVGLSGLVLLKRQDLTLQILNDEEIFLLSLGEEISALYPTWTEEEREQWNSLRRIEASKEK